MDADGIAQAIIDAVQDEYHTHNWLVAHKDVDSEVAHCDCGATRFKKNGKFYYRR